MRVGEQRHAPAVYPKETDPVPIAREAGWTSGPVYTGAEKSHLSRDSVLGPSSP